MKIETEVKGATITSEYELGESLAAAIQLFGEEVVFSQYKKGAKLTVQSKVRGLMKAEGATAETAQAGLKGWKMGVAAERSVDWDKKLAKMSPAQLKTLLEAAKRRAAAPATK